MKEAEVIDYTKTSMYKFWFNARKISAKIKRSQIRRVKVYVMLMAILFSCISPILAIENGNIPYGQKTVEYRVDPNCYIIYDNIRQKNTEYFYHDENGAEHIAYCVDLGLNGAEFADGGKYSVEANEKIGQTDTTLNNIILKCYPYRSVEEMGLQSVDEAIFASQFAIWTYTSSLNLEKMRPASPEYERVDRCIREIILSSQSDDNIVSFDKNISGQKIETIEGNKYYTKTVTFENIMNISNIEVTTNSTDVEGIKVIKEENGYKIGVPVEYVDKNEKVSISLKIDFDAKENAVLLGVSQDKDFQRVAITLDPVFHQSENIDLSFDSYLSRVKVEKLDKDTNEPLEGVVFKVTDENGEEIGRYTTDKDGKFQIELRGDKKQTIYITEEQELEYYTKNDEVYKVEVKPNEDKSVTVYNEKKKASIKIIKKTKEYNELTGIKENMPLKDVSFRIYDSTGKLVDDVTTDENGVAITKPLKCGKYYIEEYKTQDGYKLLEERVEVEITTPGEDIEVDILNENVFIPKSLPVTGK